MRVQCKINSLSLVDNKSLLRRLKKTIHLEGDICGLEIGHIYDVQAIEYHNEEGRFFIHTFEEDDYPQPYPIEFFKIIEDTIPSGWIITFDTSSEQTTIKRITFSEWANDDYFYEKLIDDDEESINIYKKNLSTV
ncbi:MAG: hypothetical protein PF692_07815 [Kiritimatiellae bacterium]|nr:hypothetical protein [Kiritimatiellia bacterium]